MTLDEARKVVSKNVVQSCDPCQRAYEDGLREGGVSVTRPKHPFPKEWTNLPVAQCLKGPDNHLGAIED